MLAKKDPWTDVLERLTRFLEDVRAVQPKAAHADGRGPRIGCCCQIARESAKDAADLRASVIVELELVLFMIRAFQGLLQLF